MDLLPPPVERRQAPHLSPGSHALGFSSSMEAVRHVDQARISRPKTGEPLRIAMAQ
jgi:hypothetical protein